jgi:hypothetical protein
MRVPKLDVVGSNPISRSKINNLQKTSGIQSERK